MALGALMGLRAGDGLSPKRRASSTRRQHALEHAQVGAVAQDLTPGGARLAARRSAAASLARRMESDDPEFEGKAADVIGLYVKSAAPCRHAPSAALNTTTREVLGQTVSRHPRAAVATISATSSPVNSLRARFM